MLRIRWYHYYIALALVVLVVILFSLQMHNLNLKNVAELTRQEQALGLKLRWIQRVQQYAQDLNSPGNDLFHVLTPEEYEREHRRFLQARQNMERVLAATPPDIGPLDLLHEYLALMTREAENLFALFSAISRDRLPDDERRLLLLDAGPTMAEMDRHQHEALAYLGTLAQKNTHERHELVQRFEASLVSQHEWQSYVIAAIILILAGILVFGRKAHQTQRALDEERHRVREERRERLAAIGELCSSVAHGIRNPLAAIRSSAQLALELGRIDGDSAERLRDILNEGQRLGDRVTGLLGIARTNSDRFANLNICEVASVAANSLLPEFQRRGIELKTVFSRYHAVISGDRNQLEQSIIELLSNAIEHTPAGGRVVVACDVDLRSCCAVLHVDDQGPGVPVEIREHVFDLFFTTKPSGTGIGLATVQRVAKLHGGDALVNGAPGGGARFTIRLPLAAGSHNGSRRRANAALN